MPRFSKLLVEFLVDDSGISSVEYALLLAFIAAGIVFGANSLSTAVTGEMNDAAACISGTDADIIVISAAGGNC